MTISVLYVGVVDPNYPRNSRLRAHLEDKFQATIEIVYVDPHRPFGRQAGIMILARLPRRQRFDVIVLSEFAIQYVVASWLVARRHRAIHVVDWFIGMHETEVEDRRRFRSGSLQARLCLFLDKIALRLADVILTDTDVRGWSLVRDYGASSLPFTLPVGAPTWLRESPGSVTREANKRKFRLLYYGNYVPLHGVDNLLKAIAICESRELVEVALIGPVREAQSYLQLAEALGIAKQCEFRPPMFGQALLREISAADVVIGVLGSSAKARSVIANKVWQALSCGKTVLNVESKALDEISDIAKPLIVLVADSSPLAIAAAIDAVRDRGIEEHAGNVSEELERYTLRRYSEFGQYLQLALAQRAARRRAIG